MGGFVDETITAITSTDLEPGNFIWYGRVSNVFDGKAECLASCLGEK